MWRPRAKGAAPDAKNRSRVMSGRAGALGAGIKRDRRLDILVAEELPYHFVFAGAPGRTHGVGCEFLNTLRWRPPGRDSTSLNNSPP